MREKRRIAGFETWVLGPGSERAHPTLILLHGRGADGSDLAALHPYLHFPGRLLCPDAPMPFVAGGTGRAWYDDATRRQDLERAVKEMLRFLKAVAEEYPTTDRPILGGFSQGGVVTYEVGLRYPEGFAGLIMMSAFMAPDHPCREAAPAPEKVPPILLTHGSEDPLITVDRAHEASAWLGAAGIAHEYVEDAAGHSLSPGHLEAINTFLRRCFLPESEGGSGAEDEIS